jgi:hypothetical protein
MHGLSVAMTVARPCLRCARITHRLRPSKREGSSYTGGGHPPPEDRFRALPTHVAAAARAIAAAAERVGVPYALAGAVAANAYGLARATQDVDVLLNREDLPRFSAAIHVAGWARRYPGARRSFRDVANSTDVDILVSGEFPGDGLPKPVAFPHLSAAGDDVEAVGPGGARVLGLVDLIQLKLASGMSAPHRRRDLADVGALIRANDLPAEFAVELDVSVRETFMTLWEEQRAARRKGLG